MNSSFDAIIVAGGLSTRMGFDKLSSFLGERTVLIRAIAPFLSLSYVKNIIVVTDNPPEGMPEKVIFAPAGKTRSLSVLSGLSKVTSPFVMIHDGARPFLTKELIEKLCSDAEEFGTAIPFIPATDTVRRQVNGEYVLCDRSEYVLLQTPQVFRSEELKKAYELSEGKSETDDSTIYTAHIGPCHYTPGDFSNKKITRPEDVFSSNALVGTGFDLHKLIPGRPLRLCGVTVPYSLGEEAHSDGDAPIHALMDALLTALSLPDIGHLFPDTDPAYKDADSTLLLKEVVALVSERNREILSVDLAILLEKPKIAPYLAEMRNVLSRVLGITPEKVNVSATTTEKIGLIGENKAVAALAVVGIL